MGILYYSMYIFYYFYVILYYSMYILCVYVYKPLPPGVYPISDDKYVSISIYMYIYIYIYQYYGTQKFITVLTSARHLSLPSTNSIQFPQPPPTSWRSILILSYHLRQIKYIHVLINYLQQAVHVKRNTRKSLS
jgi:hypothetical protein